MAPCGTWTRPGSWASNSALRTYSCRHANVRLVDFGIPVKVGGVWINLDDLLHGDQHGVVVIPHEIAERTPDAAERVAADEQRIIQTCQAEGVTVERLKAAYKSVRPDAY